jgi:hypothetical protein
VSSVETQREPSQRALQRAPAGFRPEQRARFERDGFLHLERVIEPADVRRYLDAVERVAASHPRYKPDQWFSPENVVERDPVFAELIDHPRHTGFAYDYYGELLQLHLSQLMIRPRETWHNAWHPDGPRAVPYGSFIPERPPVIKVMYWLTDLPAGRMGNLVVLPGSHRSQYLDHYDTRHSVPGEWIAICRAGAMTLLDARIWHRVERNQSDVPRVNLSLSYSPSWIVPQDRYRSDPEWLATLTREQRIIMRDYAYPYQHAKPPAEDFPLYLDRDSGLDRDPDRYADHVVLERRKRLTPRERADASD